jgi:hypothetical protein
MQRTKPVSNTGKPIPPGAPWQKGVSPNPGGRPVAARTKLTARYLNALADDFEEHGKRAIIECREQKPDRYLMVIGALMPKQIEVTRPLDGLTDDELLAIAEQLRSSLGTAEDRARDRHAIDGTASHAIPAISQAD